MTAVLRYTMIAIRGTLSLFVLIPGILLSLLPILYAAMLGWTEIDYTLIDGLIMVALEIIWLLFVAHVIGIPL